MNRSVAVVLAVAVAGCGRYAFDPTDASPTVGTSDAGADASTVTPLGRAISVGVGRSGAVCAVMETGSLWCWGDLRQGGVPLATSEVFAMPVQIGTGTDWRTVTIGAQHGCGIREPGTLWCWGINAFGEVGTGSVARVVEPEQLPGRSDWVEVTAGFNHTCARASDNVVRCWGRNDMGQLGDGSTTPRFVPQLVPGLPAARSITAGDLHTCAVDTGGTAWCWGRNSTGQLGMSGGDSLVPAPVTGSWRALHARVENTAGIASDGTLWVWGNAWGSTPMQLDTRTDWTDARATLYGACALRIGGELWCRGGGSFGVTGPLLDNNPTFTQIEPGASFDTLSVTIEVACANRDGQLSCIGHGSSGELGDLAARFDRAPRQVFGDWLRVSASSFATCGIDTSNIAHCWGATSAITNQQRPQVPTAITTPQLVALGHNGNSGVGLTASGDVWHWGHITSQPA